jgi:hypothetical protein
MSVVRERKPRYWKIAPGRHGFLWVEQRDHGCIALGWSETGDLDKYRDEEKIKNRFDKIDWGSESKPSQLLKFYKDVKPGDKVLASSGRNIYGIGMVIGNYKFDEELYYQHSKPVRWELKFWEPLDVEGLGLPERLEKRIRLNRTILELEQKEWELLDKALVRIRNPFEGFANFEGLCRAPETEQEVIILFSKLSQHLKMKIESVSTRFPDAYVRVKRGKGWVTKAAEFEINSSDFHSHGHDPRKCDMIICWKDDWKQRPEDIEIVELRKELEEIV